MSWLFRWFWPSKPIVVQVSDRDRHSLAYPLVDMTLKIHEQINEESWHQGPAGKRGGPDGKYVSLCLYAWLRYRYPGKPNMLALQGLVDLSDVIKYNETTGRTFADVHKLLVKADI